MNAKARLDRCTDYQRHVGVKYAAQMLLAFAEGRHGIRRIGSEQGGEEWDDLLVEMSDGVIEHHQVKRQTTDFSTGSLNAKAHTPFDAAMAAIGRRLLATPAPNRRFVVDVPRGTLTIRDGITVMSFRNLVEACRPAGANPDHFLAECAADGLPKALYVWLTEICGFPSDWTLILPILRQLHVRSSALEDELRRDVEADLSRLYSSGSSAYAALLNFLRDHSNPHEVTTAGAMFSHVRDQLRADYVEWVAWRRRGTVWSAITTASSRPEAVRGQWRQGGRTPKSVIDSHLAPGDTTPLAAALARFATHAPPNTVRILQPEVWRHFIEARAGRTLGSDSLGAPACGLAVADAPPSEVGEEDLALGHAEADSLHVVMDATMWESISAAINDRINAVVDPELQTEVASCWSRWRVQLDANPRERDDWLAAMLVCAAESGRVDGRIRYGRRTADLVVVAVYRALLLCVACGGGSPRAIDAVGSLRTLALREWTPTDGAPAASVAFSGATILGAEQGRVVFLAGVDASASEVLELGMAEVHGPEASIARAPGQYLVTNSKGLALSERSGLNALKRRFQDLESVRGGGNAIAAGTEEGAHVT